MLIERISKMIELRRIQKDYEKIYGIEPYNVSSWQASDCYSQNILSKLKMPAVESIDYIYTYSMEKEVIDKIKRKISPNLGDETGITLVDNGTQAIITLVNLIKQYKYKNICIVNPAYFSISKALEAYGLAFDTINFKIKDGKYILPIDKLIESKYDVVWLTCPIFSTSVYFDEETKTKIKKLMQSGTLVISDECFCVHGKELIREIEDRENFIAIYSPHKSLCINTFKFSMILYPKKYDLFIEHWVDVLTGNLPASSISSIFHFIDPNYDSCLDFYKEFMKNAYNRVEKVLSPYENIMMDEVSIGSLMTLYFKNLNYEKMESREFITAIIYETGLAYYPSFLNGLDESFGFAFRINLALYNDEFIISLEKLAKTLSEK